MPLAENKREDTKSPRFLEPHPLPANSVLFLFLPPLSRQA